MNIAEKQIYLINHVRSYFKKLKAENISQLNSVFCYFSIWSPLPGLSKLRTLKKDFLGNLNLFISILKGVISISKQSNFVTINNNNKTNVSKLVVTWAYKNNFLSNGS